MHFSNRGMFLENLIEQTANYYLNSKQCVIFKRSIPISIINNKGNGLVEAKLKQKSQSDYYGCYHQKMFDFEAKQTNKTSFSDELVKQHQKDHLLLMQNDFNILSFFIIHFVYYDKFFAININDYINKISNKKTIDYEWFVDNCFELKIIFPGILDIIGYLKYIKY